MGGGMVAITSAQLIAFLTIAIVIPLGAGFIAYQAKGRIKPKGLPDIPPAMQPGPSDGDLEKSRLEKMQGWSLGFVVLFAVLLPLVWLKEPSNNQSQARDLLLQSIDRGAQSVQLFSEENQLGVGCVRCHGDNPVLGGGTNIYNGVLVHPPPLNNVCAGPNVPVHSSIHNLDDVRQTIMRGRPGTDMPSWSIRFQGALDDQQIQDILNYIVSIQKDGGVKFSENVCINPKAKGFEAPSEPAS
jgi:mono/diheme cytochrome c family protein